MLTHTVRFVQMANDIVEKDERKEGKKNEKHTRTLARINVSQKWLCAQPFSFVDNNFLLLFRRLFIAFNWPLLH